MYVCGWNQAWILTWKLALNGQNALILWCQFLRFYFGFKGKKITLTKCNDEMQVD